MNDPRLVASTPGSGYVPIIIGGLLLVLVLLVRLVPEGSLPSKLLSSLLTRWGQYDLSPTRLRVLVGLSLTLVALGIALVSTGH